MNSFTLALKLLKREWRAGELRILVIALFIAIACMTSVNIFGDRIERAMQNQASELLGGDLALTSNAPIPDNWLKEAKKLQIRYTRTIVFFSMLSTENTLQLASIKAVDTGYPLRGELKIATQPFQEGNVTKNIPAPGTLWMQSNLFPLLKVKTGDRLTLGAMQLNVTQALIFQPDPPGRAFSFTPYAIMNIEDMDKAKIIQPGSRVEYSILFAGDKKNLDTFAAWLEPQLLPGQKLIRADKNRPSLEKTLTRVRHYLGLGSLMSVILAGVALAVALKRFTRRHYDVVALMRCYGADTKKIFTLYSWMLFLVGILGTLLGCLVGYLSQNMLEKALAAFVQFELPTASLSGLWFGACSGLLVLFAFGFPPLWQLTRVSPLKILRRDLEPAPVSSIWLYLSGFTLIFALVLWYTRDTKLAMIILNGCMLACVLFLLGGWGLIRLTGMTRKKVGVAWRYGLANLSRRWQSSILQITAFGFTLMVLLLLIVVKNDLIAAWQNELPENTPNYFVMNISPDQVEEVKHTLEKASVNVEQIFPMIRARLYLLNHQKILDKITGEKRQDEIFQREVNLSFTDKIPHNNKIISGRWFEPTDKAVISVEEGLAERLGLKIGDTLGFRIGAETIEAKIINLRELNWSSLQPNFYVLFPPGMLEKYPSTYITSFYLPKDASPVLNTLIAQFPNLTVINVAEILKQVQGILLQAGKAIQYLLFFAFLAGFVVLYASIYATLDQRLYEGAILRAMGASRYQLLTGLIAEFVTLGALSGFLGALMANGIGMALGYWLFDLTLQFNYLLVLIGIAVGAVMIGGVGCFATRSIVRQSPLLVMSAGAGG